PKPPARGAFGLWRCPRPARPVWGSGFSVLPGFFARPPFISTLPYLPDPVVRVASMRPQV
ncbi:unnamed protein product, partial [Amoebophrya sp. A120]